MKPVPHSTDLRASLASGTVKKRIRMCGRPAVPNISAMPSEIAEIGFGDAADPGAIDLHDRVVCGMDLDRLGEQRLGAEAEVRQHHERHEGRAAQQQAGLDDLHPGGRGHAAEGHVDDHQHADDDDRHPVVQAEQQLDQLAGADHLRDQVEGDDHQRAERREDADRRLR